MVVLLAFGWRHLLFANWPVKSVNLTERVPQQLTVDEYDGMGWISVIPFVNIDIRPRGVPGFLGIDVVELNCRTYVTKEGEPGVYFFSLDAQDIPTVLGARITHRLPYYYARGAMHIEPSQISFESHRCHPGDPPVQFEATYAGIGEPFVPEPGSLAAFLTERRRLYTQSSNGTLRYTDVTHEPWTLYEAAATLSTDTVFSANRLATPRADPVLYYSPGVDVTVSPSQPWPDS